MLKRIGVTLGFTLSLACLIWLTGSFSFALAPAALRAAPNETEPAATTQTIVTGESRDFATLVLREPWDMDQYADVSQYLNESGQRRLVRDVRVENGIFTGVSEGTAANGDNAYFFPLFTGYETTMLLGKVGHNFPIASNEYQCLYIAMKVDSGPANSMGPDQFVVYWFEDERLVQRNGIYGVTGGIPLYPEAGANQPNHSWRLYRVDLDDPPHGLRPDTKAEWSDLPLWRGIRIDPTINRDVKFQVDWVRLTACDANRHTVSWSPNGEGSALWVRAEGTNHYIRVATGVDGASGSHELDVQGITPGTYRVALGTDTSCCLAGNIATLDIRQRPIIDFVRPSFISGEDYYTAATGRPWNFEEDTDVVNVVNLDKDNDEWRIENNQLHVTTPPGPLPAGVDGQVHFDTPEPFSTSEYRFLTYRMYAEWASPWQDVTSGMISRWVWTMPSLTGQAGYECHLVTQDVPFNVGWHTYTIDLNDWFQGSPEGQQPIGPPHCPPLPTIRDQPPTNIGENPAHWLNTGPVHQLRVNPNENVSCEFGETKNAVVPCSPYYQIFDWVRLTKVDSVAQGNPFPIEFEMNLAASAVSSFEYFYTTNRAEPRQNRAAPSDSRTAAVSNEEPAQVAARAAREIPEAVEQAIAAGNSSSTFNQPSGVVFLPAMEYNVDGGSADEPANPGGGGNVEDADFVWDTTGVASGLYYICIEATTQHGAAIHCSDAPVQVE